MIAISVTIGATAARTVVIQESCFTFLALPTHTIRGIAGAGGVGIGAKAALTGLTTRAVAVFGAPRSRCPPRQTIRKDKRHRI